MKRKILPIVLMFVLSTCSFLLFACDKQEVTPQETITFTIEGATDHIIKIGDTGYDFLSGVVAKGSDDSEVTPECDTSEIDFNTAGEYEITYSYLNAEDVIKSATVYAMPAFIIAEGKDPLELSYVDAQIEENLLEGITAKDGFDVVLDVSLLDGEDGGLTNNDGSINYGEFDVSYFTIDSLGNTSVITRVVKVIEDVLASPEFNVASLSSDVTETSIEFEVNLKDNELEMISFDGVPFGIDSFSIVDGIVTIDTEELFATIELGTFKLRVVTNCGYKELDVEVKDAFEPMLDLFGKNNWIFEKDVAGLLPTVSKLNNYQRYIINYELKDTEGNDVTIIDGMFTPDQVGVYSLIVNALRGESLEASVTLDCEVFETEDYVKLFDLGNSTQKLNTVIKKGGSSTAGTKFEYTEEEIGGIKGSYCLSIPDPLDGTTAEWYYRVEFYGEETFIKSNYKWSIDMYLTNNANPRFWNYGNAAYWLTTANKVYMKDANGNLLFSVPQDSWFTVEMDINLEGVFALPLVMGSNVPGAEIYFRNVKLINTNDTNLDFTGLDNWVYGQDVAATLPSISSLKDVTYSYNFTSPTGDTFTVEDQDTYGFSEVGEYTYTMNVNYDGRLIGNKTGMKLNVSESAPEYFISGTTKQGIKNVVPVGESQLTYSGIVIDDITGPEGAFRASRSAYATIKPGDTNLTRAAWYSRIEIQNITGTELAKKYLAIDVFMSEGSYPNFWIGDATSWLVNDHYMRIFDSEGNLVKASYNEWNTIYVSLAIISTKNYIRIGIATPSSTLYFRNIRLLDETKVPVSFDDIINNMFEVNTESSLPILRGIFYKNITYTYTNWKLNDVATEVTVLTGNKFVPTVEGNYSCTINVIRGEEIIKSEDVTLTVVSTELFKTYYSRSDNPINNILDWDIYYENAFFFDHTDVGGVTGSYHLLNSMSERTVEQGLLDTKFSIGFKVGKLTTFTPGEAFTFSAEIYVTGDASKLKGYIGTTAVDTKYYDMEGTLMETPLANTWMTVEIDMSTRTSVDGVFITYNDCGESLYITHANIA